MTSTWTSVPLTLRCPRAWTLSTATFWRAAHQAAAASAALAALARAGAASVRRVPAGSSAGPAAAARALVRPAGPTAATACGESAESYSHPTVATAVTARATPTSSRRPITVPARRIGQASSQAAARAPSPPGATTTAGRPERKTVDSAFMRSAPRSLGGGDRTARGEAQTGAPAAGEPAPDQDGGQRRPGRPGQQQAHVLVGGVQRLGRPDDDEGEQRRPGQHRDRAQLREEPEADQGAPLTAAGDGQGQGEHPAQAQQEQQGLGARGHHGQRPQSNRERR